ncbi:hypothetical protein FF38_06573 [Lucilia cuprina]|uniref:Uncharacterized protein n=1 Tax=Lucilia cuprina TaxID=7375 RepID=A0A0L0CD62_LUCCU|nr:hypothetical protein FF38_06573 [Lucilia cuprina]
MQDRCVLLILSLCGVSILRVRVSMCRVSVFVLSQLLEMSTRGAQVGFGLKSITGDKFCAAAETTDTPRECVSEECEIRWFNPEECFLPCPDMFRFYKNMVLPTQQMPSYLQEMQQQQTALATTTTLSSSNNNNAAISKGQQISFNHQEKTLKVVM